MRSLLTRLGHHAVIATNGEEALESWLAAKSAGTPYDLVLMDIQMPQLDGIETTKTHPRPRGRPAGPADADPGADREHAGGRPLCLFRGRYGRLSDQAARSRQARRGAGGPCRLAASRRLRQGARRANLDAAGDSDRACATPVRAKRTGAANERPQQRKNVPGGLSMRNRFLQMSLACLVASQFRRPRSHEAEGARSWKPPTP